MMDHRELPATPRSEAVTETVRDRPKTSPKSTSPKHQNLRTSSHTFEGPAWGLRTGNTSHSLDSRHGFESNFDSPCAKPALFATAHRLKFTFTKVQRGYHWESIQFSYSQPLQRINHPLVCPATAISRVLVPPSYSNPIPTACDDMLQNEHSKNHLSTGMTGQNHAS